MPLHTKQRASHPRISVSLTSDKISDGARGTLRRFFVFLSGARAIFEKNALLLVIFNKLRAQNLYVKRPPTEQFAIDFSTFKRYNYIS